MSLEVYLSALGLMDSDSNEWTSDASRVQICNEYDLVWLFESPEYKKWKEVNESTILWLGGTSILENTHAVKQILRQMADQDYVILHAFHTPPDTYAGKTAAGSEAIQIVRTLLRQVQDESKFRLYSAMHHHSLNSINKPAPKIMDSQDWKLKKLIDVLFACLVADPNSSTCFVVDGIDVMGGQNYRFLTQLLHLIQSHTCKNEQPTVKFLFTSTIRSLPEPLGEAHKELASIPYIEKDKETIGNHFLFG